MESTITKRKMAVVLVASAVGLVGLTTAGIGLMWVAGALGISAAAASQIVDAIQAGGLALAIVSAIFGAGVIAAIIATVRSIAAASDATPPSREPPALAAVAQPGQARPR